MRNSVTRHVRFDVSRRRFLAAASGVASAVVMQGPGGVALADTGDVTYFTWAGYELPEFHQEFIDEHGGSPDSTFFASEDEALAKLRAGFKADVLHPCTYSIQRWYDADVIRPIDVSRLPRWSEVMPDLVAVIPVWEDDAPLWIPWDWGHSSLVVRSDLVEPELLDNPSWSLLLDERLSGRIAMWDALETNVGIAARIAGVADPNDVTDEEFERIMDVLRKLHSQSKFYWSYEQDIQPAMASGEVVATYLWPSVVNRLTAEGVAIEYVENPQEGKFYWGCGLALGAGGEGDEAAAYDLINAMLAPESGKYLIDEYGFGHSNAKSFEIADPEAVRAFGVSGDVGGAMQGARLESLSPSMLARYTTAFEEIKAGM